MKKLYLCLCACLLLCTGCGKKIDQTRTFTTETTSGTISETTTEQMHMTTEKKFTTATSGISTEITSGTNDTHANSTSVSVSSTTATENTKLISTEIVQNQDNPNETEVVYYYEDNASGKKSTFVSRATNAKITQTTTKTTTTVPPPVTEPVIFTAEPPPEPETQPVPEFVPLSGNAEEILNQMTLEQKIYQLFVVTPEMLTGLDNVTAGGTRTQESLYQQPVGGLVYFANNLLNGGQVSEMLSNTQQYALNMGVGVFLAVDEEGGTVARCAKQLGTTALSPMAVYGERNDWNEAFSVGQTLGNDIRQFGFNVDFAPVADVNLNSGNELGNRIFSDNPEVVGNMVSGVVQGLQSTGTAATLKHFPGLGAENGNAHYDSQIIIDRSLDDLRNEEFIPFRNGIDSGADFVMVSHQIITGAGDNLPSCLSHVICTDMLRNELNFSGIIITDSFQMNTISGSYSAGTAAVMAIEAGVDMILMPTDLNASVQALENAVENGVISEERINESVYRILSEKEKLSLLG